MSDSNVMFLTTSCMLVLCICITHCSGKIRDRIRHKVAWVTGFSMAAAATAYLYIYEMNPSILDIYDGENAIVLTNLSPLLLASAIGFIDDNCRVKEIMKLAVGFIVFQPTIVDIPLCQDIREDGIVMQSTETTCGPASAATLLSINGVHATEQEMAKYCLTDSARGTRWLGIYRGLKLKTRGTDLEVVATNEFQTSDLPAIVIVENGSIRGSHALVITGASKTSYFISDPCLGMCVIDKKGFENHYKGVCLQLRKREKVK